MKSILIKDTTKEERAKIVADSLGDDYELGCGYESAGINYDLYIEGKKELRELNSEARCGFEVAYPRRKFQFELHEVLVFWIYDVDSKRSLRNRSAIYVFVFCRIVLSGRLFWRL